MRIVQLPMCPTDDPMARGARGDIPGNRLGQGSTITSTLTHVWGAYGAPTLCRRRAADGRRSLLRTSKMYHILAQRAMGWGRLVDPWPRLLPGMSPLAPLAMGPSVGHMGSSTVCIRTFLNVHLHDVLSCTAAYRSIDPPRRQRHPARPGPGISDRHVYKSALWNIQCRTDVQPATHTTKARKSRSPYR